MSIADINKTMALYAQPTEFDQNAWKTVFDIANGFSNAENNRTLVNENARKYQENLATQNGRIQELNAQNQANAAKHANELTQQQALTQGWELLKQGGIDETGKARTYEEFFNWARQNPQINLNPALFATLFGNSQKFQQAAAQNIAPYNPALAANMMAGAGLSSFTLDQNGQVTNLATNTPAATLPTPADLANFAAGNGWANYHDQLKNQLATQKAIEAAQARGEIAQDKQGNWINAQQSASDWKVVSPLISQVMQEANGDRGKINTSIRALIQSYPHLAAQIEAQAKALYAVPNSMMP